MPLPKDLWIPISAMENFNGFSHNPNYILLKMLDLALFRRQPLVIISLHLLFPHESVVNGYERKQNTMD